VCTLWGRLGTALRTCAGYRCSRPIRQCCSVRLAALQCLKCLILNALIQFEMTTWLVRVCLPGSQLAASPAQPSPAQPSPAQPSPAQPSPAQPSPAPPQGDLGAQGQGGGSEPPPLPRRPNPPLATDRRESLTTSQQ
jgi:hypothetical protein